MRRLFLLTLSLCLSFGLLACGDTKPAAGNTSGTPAPPPPPAGGSGNQATPEPTPTPDTTPSPVPGPSSDGYQELEDFEGFTVSGRVTWKGDAPEPVMLECLKNPETCCSEVAAKPAERLLVGPQGGVGNALVYLEQVDAGKALPKARPTLDQVGCQYLPRIVIFERGKKISVKSSDEILHNVHVYDGNDTPPGGNISFAVPGKVDLKLDPGIGKTPRFYELRCDAGHNWMTGWLIAVEHPYYVLTEADGSFSLEGVPEGVYNLMVWHEGWEVVETLRGPTGLVTGYVFSDPFEMREEIIVEGEDQGGLEFSLN